MAFPKSYAIKTFLLFEIIAITCSGIAAESKASWDPTNGPFVLVRLKRSPHRAITFSGFNPNNGLTAFATSADFLPPYYNYPSQFGYPVESRGDPYTPSASSSDSSPPSDYTPDYQPNAEYPPTTDEDRKLIPSQNLTPPSEQAPNTAYNQNTFQPVKKPKKKPSHIEDDEDEDDAVGKSRSTSHASFNAWFPIMLGMYPSRGGGSDSYKEDASAAVKEGRYGDRSLGTTVISNSVSHGKSSVASSHAIAYGGEGPMKAYRQG